MESSWTAPAFPITSRDIIAVEHPMIIKNIDKGLKTFGTGDPFNKIILSDSREGCLPLYLRLNDPTCAPILSHNASTNNLLLRINVPKRIGRKRKRGSDDQFARPEELEPQAASDKGGSVPQNIPVTDAPIDLLKKLQDNEKLYSIEVVGRIEQSHRFKGMTDFAHSTSNGQFMSKFKEKALSGHVDDMRQFSFDNALGWKVGEEILPPPNYSDIGIPFNWGWHQNSNLIQKIDLNTGQTTLVSRAMPDKLETEYLSRDVPQVPLASSAALPEDPMFLGLLSSLQKVMDERPIWTRRALTNLMMDNPGFYLIKSAFQHVGYQFRSGPFRDAIIKFGVDPRTDKKYRMFQTMFFKIHTEEDTLPGMPWHDARQQYTKRADGVEGQHHSHIFDGKTLLRDGRVWQLCDITDPLLSDLIKNAPAHERISGGNEGWFYNGSWSKIRAIMKTKIIAIQTHKSVDDGEFKAALEVPDLVDTMNKRGVCIPVPDLRLTEKEIEELKAKGMFNAVGSSGLIKRRHKGKKRNERIRKGAGKKLQRPRERHRNQIPQHISLDRARTTQDEALHNTTLEGTSPTSNGSLAVQSGGSPIQPAEDDFKSVLDPALWPREHQNDSQIGLRGSTEQNLGGHEDDEEAEEGEDGDDDDDDDEAGIDSESSGSDGSLT